MPAKKHRPIVMNRNKRPGRTTSIIRKAILITAFLALVEVIILVVLHFKNAAEKPVVKVEEKQKQAQSSTSGKTAEKNAAGLRDVTGSKTVPAAQADPPLKKDNVQIVKPEAAKTQQLVQKGPEDTVTKPIAKPKEVKQHKVSDDKMFEILNQVKLEKLQANNTAKCVTIQIINSTNAENGFRIANYLRKNGYVISGREVVSGTQRGIQIDASGPCVKLAVGDL